MNTVFVIIKLDLLPFLLLIHGHWRWHRPLSLRRSRPSVVRGRFPIGRALISVVSSIGLGLYDVMPQFGEILWRTEYLLVLGSARLDRLGNRFRLGNCLRLVGRNWLAVACRDLLVSLGLWLVLVMRPCCRLRLWLGLLLRLGGWLRSGLVGWALRWLLLVPLKELFYTLLVLLNKLFALNMLIQ